MIKSRFLLPIVGLLVTLSQFAAAAPVTSFFFSSSPESWVGGGETVEVTPVDGFTFTAQRNFDGGVFFAINDFVSNPDPWSTRWWYLNFSAGNNQPLVEGVYNNAARFPFQEPNQAGLSFYGNGHGDNTLTGFFDVWQADYAADGTVLAFAANFVQYDEGIDSWWNIGGIRYNSRYGRDGLVDIPTELPEPSALTVFLMGILGLGIARRLN